MSLGNTRHWCGLRSEFEVRQSLIRVRTTLSVSLETNDRLETVTSIMLLLSGVGFAHRTYSSACSVKDFVRLKGIFFASHLDPCVCIRPILLIRGRVSSYRLTMRPGFPGFVPVLLGVFHCPNDLGERAKLTRFQT